MFSLGIQRSVVLGPMRWNGELGVVAELVGHIRLKAFEANP